MRMGNLSTEAGCSESAGFFAITDVCHYPAALLAVFALP
jgi:hypothetical protein